MTGSGLEGVLFDLDGTLLDSVELIVASFQFTIEAGGLRVRSRAEILSDFGRPLSAVFPEWSGQPERTEELISVYRGWNREHHDLLAKPYPGICQAVGELAASGLRLGVVTSKSREAALRGVELCGLAEVLGAMVACDDIDQHKPHPAPILAGCALIGVAPEASAYVGDAVVDMQAGRAAGVSTVAALWGVEDETGLQGEAPDFWLDEPAGLLRLQ